MKKAIYFYFNRLMASIVKHIWAGIWTAIGFIMIMKCTGIFIVLTS